MYTRVCSHMQPTSFGLWTCMHARNHAYIQTNIYTYRPYVPYIHTYGRTYVRTYLHTYIHTCIHIYINMYIHIHTLRWAWSCILVCKYLEVDRSTDMQTVPSYSFACSEQPEAPRDQSFFKHSQTPIVEQGPVLESTKTNHGLCV